MRLVILFILLLWMNDITAQHVTGFIRGKEGPIPGATVQVSSELGRVTDAQGIFTFEKLPPGDYDLVVRSMGYSPLHQRITVTPNDTLTLRFQLEENSLGLQEVVVTGTMAPVSIKDSPVKVEVITSKHLTTFLPSAATGVMESVSLINGIQEVVACGVCFTNSISINGLPGPYTAVLLDGTPMFGNLASVYGLNGIPSSMIDRIEVIKGPNSTLYGSEAVAGVINVITKDPADQPVISADVMTTSHREMFNSLSLATSVGKSNGQIGFNHAYVNLFEDDNGDGFGDIVNLDRFSLFTKWNISRPSDKKWSLAAKYYYEDRRNGVEEYLVNRNYKEFRGSDSIYGESIYTKRAELFGSYELNSPNNLRLDYAFSSHDQNSFYGSDGYLARQHIGFTNLLWSPDYGDHQLMGGLTLRYQSYDDNTIATPEADRQFIPGLFLQDEWRVSPRISLLGGTRFDHYQRHGLILSPRFNVKYTPGSSTTVRFNFGTGFRLVNLFTEDHAFITGQREVVIEEELNPERSVNGALNLNHIFALGESQGSVDVDIFYTYFTNKILPDYSEAEVIRYKNSAEHAVTKGMSFTWSHELALPVSFSIGMSIQRATESLTTSDGQSSQRNIEFAPEYTGVVTINYQWKKAKLQFAYSSQITGPMELPEVFDLDEQGSPLSSPRPVVSTPFSIHSLQLTRPFTKGFTLYGGIQNIFNFKQSISPLTGYNDPNARPGFSNYFDTAYSFAPIHGRELYLGIQWKLTHK